MSAVWKKAWADLRGRFWQSALITLTVAGAAAMLYLGLAGLLASSSPYEKQMERANGAHAWFYLKDTADGRAAAERIAARPEVVERTQRPALNTYLVAPDSDRVPWVIVMPLPTGQPRMMGYILLEGRDLQPSDRGSALLPVSMAQYLHVGLGDSVDIQTPGGPRRVQTVGLITDPRSCTFPRCDGSSLIVPPETFTDLAAGDKPLILEGVRIRQPETADAFVSQVRTAEAGLVTGATSWLQRVDFYRGDQLFSVVPILLFSLIAIAAACLILATIIGGSILGQYREIAVLKALGFTGRQVLLLFVGQTAVLSVAGTSLGLLAGHVLAIRSMAPLARSMGTPDVLHFMPGVAGAVLAITVPVAALVAGLAAWRAVSLRPAVMLADGFAAPRARTPMPVRLLTRLRLPAPILLGVKDATARPARTAMTLLTLTVCLITVTQSLNFPADARQIWDHRELIGINWDMTVQPKLISPAEAEAAVKELPQMQAYWREVYSSATAVDQHFDLFVRAVDGDLDRLGFRLIEGRMPQRPGEILLAPRAWERLGVKAGEQLRLQMDGRVVPLTVVGKYQDVMENGRIALTTANTMQLFPLTGEHLDLLRVKLAPGADWTAARRTFLERTRYLPLVIMELAEMPDFARDAVDMMGLLGWVMGGIAALSIMGAALLTAREQMREAGIRKVVGMSPAQTLVAAAAGGAWFGLIALALALPGAYLLQKVVIAGMSGVMGVGAISLDLPGRTLLLAALVGMLLAVAAVLPAAIWGARLKPARVLQAE